MVFTVYKKAKILARSWGSTVPPELCLLGVISGSVGSI